MEGEEEGKRRRTYVRTSQGQVLLTALILMGRYSPLKRTLSMALVRMWCRSSKGVSIALRVHSNQTASRAEKPKKTHVQIVPTLLYHASSPPIPGTGSFLLSSPNASHTARGITAGKKSKTE